MTSETPPQIPQDPTLKRTCVITQEGDEIEVDKNLKTGETSYCAPCCNPDGTDNKANPCKQERISMPTP